MNTLRFEDLIYMRQYDLFEVNRINQTYFYNELKKLKLLIKYLTERYYEGK